MESKDYEILGSLWEIDSLFISKIRLALTFEKKVGIFWSRFEALRFLSIVDKETIKIVSSTLRFWVLKCDLLLH